MAYPIADFRSFMCQDLEPHEFPALFKDADTVTKVWRFNQEPQYVALYPRDGRAAIGYLSALAWGDILFDATIVLDVTGEQFDLFGQPIEN